MPYSTSSSKSSMMALDVEASVQSILRGNTKEGFKDIVVISCANHMYLSQWKSIQWNVSNFKGIIETVRRHEVNDLKYGGRSAWILYMMLEHGAQSRSWSFFEQDKDLVNTMLATLLRILIEHSNYNQIYHIFRSLINSYGLKPIEIFSSGCELLELLPAVIKDENFICLLELGVTSIEKDPSCRPFAIKMLSNCSKFVICNWKSNFFLDQKLSILNSALQQKPHELASTCDSTFDTIQLFRRLATIQEQNAEHILNDAHVIDSLCSLISSENATSFHIRREILATFNVLTRVKNGRLRVQSILSMAQLSDLIVGGDDLLVTESVLDLFFNLYEADMEYWDDAFHYVIQDGCPYSLFFRKVLQHCIQTLEDDFPFVTSSDENQNPVSVSNKPNASIHLDAVARICFRLERSVFVLSDARSFLPVKTSLLQICARIVGDDFARFPLRNHSVIDIICYILRGTQRCWLPATFDSLDEDFIYVSSSLVEQFLTVTKKKIFDQKDMNSLLYLAGADTHSPIQTMISKSNEDQQAVEANLHCHKVRGHSSLSVDDTIGVFPSTNTGLDEVPELYFSTPTHELDSPCDIILKEQERSAFLTVVESLLQQIVRRVSWLRHNVDNWELDSSDVTARRVCYMMLIMRLFGVTFLEKLVPHLNNLRGVVFQLLVDPSLSLSAYLGIESKCLQLLSLLCLHHGGFDQSVQCYEYLINIISSNPEMLSERRRSEYQREQVSMDSPTSPFHDNNNAHYTNPSLADTSLLGSHLSSGSNDLLEISNLMGAQLQLLYDAVNALLVLSDVERSVRRKLVASCANLLDCLSYYVPVDPITHRPVLYLASSLIEYAAKFEMEAEEAVVTMIIRTLNSPLHYIRYQSCTYIYNIGAESPGFIFRGLSRREVEDPILDIVSHSPFEYPRLIVAAIKASATLVHNFNIKPVWFPSLILYHWRCYQPHLAQRPLLGVSCLALVISRLQHVQVPYRLLYFTYTLSLSASLMYACSELTGNPNPNDMRILQEMKDHLIAHVLPWLPLAIDFISLGKRKRRFDFMEMLSSHHSKSEMHKHASSSVSVPVTTSSPAFTQVKPLGEKEKEHIDTVLHQLYARTSLSASCTTSSEVHYVPFHAVHHNAWSFFLDVVFNMDKFDQKASVIGEASELVTVYLDMGRVSAINVTVTASEPPSETSSLKKDLHDHAIISEKCTLTPTASEQSEQWVIDALKTSFLAPSPYHRYAHHKHRHHHQHDASSAESVYCSKSMEFLTVVTVDALYAFLCMDDMYPLSTYLRFSHLFEQCHVIASVSYFMCEHYENVLILKRGLDLLRYFSDHQMQLSSIAMHSPPALIATVRFMQDNLEAQLSFAKIILAICRTDDDFARENLLRFRVHQVLLELVLREPNAELVRTSIQALLALATTVAHLREIAKLELPAYLAPVKLLSSSYGSSNNSSNSNSVFFLGTGSLVPPEITATNNGNNSNNSTADSTATGSNAITTVTGGGSQKILSMRRTSNILTGTTVTTTPEQQNKPYTPANAPLPPTSSTASTSSHAHILHTSDASHFLAYQSNPSSTPFSIIQKPSTTTTTATSSSIVSIPKSSSASSIHTSLPSNLATINVIDVLLYVLDTQTKEIRTHFYALRLLVLVEIQYKNAVHQVLRKSSFAGAIKKSKKALKKTFIDDASGDNTNNAISLNRGSPTQHLNYTHSNNNSGGNSNNNSRNSNNNNSQLVVQNGALLYRGMSTDQSNSAALGKSEEIERREVEILLNEAIIKNDRCAIS